MSSQGTSVFHDEATPSATSEVRHGDDSIRDFKAVMADVWDAEHFYSPSAGTAQRGGHRIGSARVLVDGQSNLSASNATRGNLYFASDTTRLFVVPASGATAFVGSFGLPEVISYAVSGNPSAFYPGQNVRWALQCGEGTTGASTAALRITFSPAYNGTPILGAISGTGTGVSAGPKTMVVQDQLTNSFATFMSYDDSGASAPSQIFWWFSLGTVTF